MDGAVLTNPEYQAKIAAKRKEKEKKVKVKLNTKKSKPMKKMIEKKKQKVYKYSGQTFRKMMNTMVHESDEEHDKQDDIPEDLPENDYQNLSKEVSDHENTINDQDLTPEDLKEKKTILEELDDHNIGKFFAVFWPKPRTYYWGKLLKVFAEDVEADADQVEIQFLKKVENSSDPSQLKWDWPIKEDVGIVDAKLCFAGPCMPNIADSSRKKAFLTFASEGEVMDKFNDISKHGI